MKVWKRGVWNAGIKHIGVKRAEQEKILSLGLQEWMIYFL